MRKNLLLLITVVFLSMTSAFAQGGTTGQLTWQLTGTVPNYTLTISGVGEMPNYNGWNDVPWYEYRKSIITIVIENGVTNIGDRAFYYCQKLTLITIANSVTTIGNEAFYECIALNSITIPNNVISIGNDAFTCCRALNSIIIPSNVTSIGVSAFNSCTDLASITILNGVANIGARAFCTCSALTSITIPKSVMSLGDGTFTACLSLSSINVDNENVNYSSENGILFNKNKTKLVCYPAGKTENNFFIPNNVTSIGHSAFYYCTTLISITIPNSVKSIEDWAFGSCTNLTSIDIPNSVTSIGDWAFYNCKSLLSIVIPNRVSSIGKSTFSSCYLLTSITIPNCVTSIGEDAFRECKALTSITIPSSITSIGDYAFLHCTALTSITNLNLAPIDIASNVFAGMNQSACTLTVPTNAVSAFQNDEVWNEFNIHGGGILINPISSNCEYGYTTGNELYEVSATAIITATAYYDYKFVNWTKNGEIISIENPYSFTVTEDIELVANFEEEVGIENFELSNLKIYPNPTTGQLKIESEGTKIENVEIFDVFGKNVLSQRFFISPETMINISHLPSGVYFVRIQTETGEIVGKVLKE